MSHTSHSHLSMLEYLVKQFFPLPNRQFPEAKILIDATQQELRPTNTTRTITKVRKRKRTAL